MEADLVIIDGFGRI